MDFWAKIIAGVVALSLIVGAGVYIKNVIQENALLKDRVTTLTTVIKQKDEKIEFDKQNSADLNDIITDRDSELQKVQDELEAARKKLSGREDGKQPSSNYLKDFIKDFPG